MSKMSFGKQIGIALVIIAVLGVLVLFLTGADTSGFFTGNVAQLSLVSDRGDFKCDAWNEIATRTGGSTRTVASGNERFNPLFDSSLLSLTSNVDALILRLVLQCEGDFIEQSRSTTVTGKISTKICGSGSPEICYVGADRNFNNLQGVATVSTVFQDIPISAKALSDNQRVVIWEGSIGKSQLEAIGKAGSITFTSRMYPVLTFTFDHPTKGVFTAKQDSSIATGTGDLIYAQYGGVTLSQPDSDGDGITDNLDSCVGQPEDFNGFEDSDGCPDAFKLNDSDNDGITDINDECPTQPETVNGFLDEDGCPDINEELGDTDGDGILNGVDACPNDAHNTSDGCPDDPPPIIPDTDNDGLIDTLDQCPTEFSMESDGCPLIDDTPTTPLDTDGDGVNDLLDLCPSTIFGELVDSTGCVLPTTQDIVSTPNDFDGDGIIDSLDDCPASGGTVDQFGCPLDESSQDDTQNPVQDFFEDIFEPTPTVNTSPQTTVTGTSTSSAIVEGITDSVLLLIVVFIIVIVVVVVLLKSGKAKL